MILEFADHQYVDVDSIQALRWIEVDNKAIGIVALNGDKIAVTERDEFDVIEAAFLYTHKSHIVDDKMKKVRYIKGDNNG
jgi:hypothetical protein